ncbi:MAG: hypothetical protein KBT01_06940, partial [Clostridiales bacterium]|nr:hypothetical protein [Candidatus Blautia equi]
MNEIRDLIVGIDFGAKTSQICYYDRKAAEPVSVPVKLGSSQLEIPNYICKKAGTTEYVIGLDAEYFAREKGGTLLDHLYEISRRAEPVQIAEDEKTPGELLAIYLKGLLRYLGVMDIVKNTRILTVTTPSLDAQQVRNWSEAFARMGFSREKCKLMDYEESFYYYFFTQKKDLWNRNIAWYSFDGNDVTYRNFEMKNTEKNVQIRLSEPQYTVLPVEGPVR